MPHRQYRSLERECHIQAAIAGDEKTKQELKKMEREYKGMADWLESRLEQPRSSPTVNTLTRRTVPPLTPDTFLGRKTQEPLPSEGDDPIERADIQNLITAN